MWERTMTKRAVVRIVARHPAKARGTLIYRALVPIMTETMTGMAGLMITRMSSRERNL